MFIESRNNRIESEFKRFFVDASLVMFEKQLKLIAGFVLGNSSLQPSANIEAICLFARTILNGDC